MQLGRASDLSCWPILWRVLLCLACSPSHLGAGEPNYSVLLVCHATGTALTQLNSLFSCDAATIVWTLPLFAGGTQPCHFLCCAIIIHPVLVLDQTLACFCAMRLSLFVWTLPLFVGGTWPCHFLCCAKLQCTNSYCCMMASTSISEGRASTMVDC